MTGTGGSGPRLPLPTPVLRPLCDLTVHLADPIEMGDGPAGRRRIIPIIGGTVTGDRLAGTVLPIGADWQTVFFEGHAELDARYALRTHDGAVVEIRNFGYRHGPPEAIAALASGETIDPALYSMRTHPRFETGDARYSWLNRVICVGTGARLADRVLISVFDVT